VSKICYCREVETKPAATDTAPRESTPPSSGYGFTDLVVDVFTGATTGVPLSAATALVRESKK
jgi:hypothetical protein